VEVEPKDNLSIDKLLILSINDAPTFFVIDLKIETLSKIFLVSSSSNTSYFLSNIAKRPLFESQSPVYPPVSYLLII